MKILVTGCAGFIGWKVTESLLKEGHSVVGIDNLNDAYDVRIKEWRLSQLQSQDKLTFSQIDIIDKDALSSICRDHEYDAVINLAARAGVPQSVEIPKVYYESNVTGTLNLLDLCKEQGIRKFVLASTSSLYGSHKPEPFREDADTSRPLSPYAASKKAAEILCYTYHFLYDIDVSVLRYFTVYGPAGRPDMSLFRFVKWISEGQPVTLYGDGQQSRDFTYIDDVARGTIAALKPLGFEIVNLGSYRPVILLDAVRLIEQYIGRPAILEYGPAHPADVPATWANIDKARLLLDWTPQVEFKDGIRNITRWYTENRDWACDITT